MTTITPDERAQWRKESRAEYVHFSQDGMRLMRALDALEAAETTVARYKTERAGGWAKRAVAEQRRADAAEDRVESEYQRANDVSGKLMQMSVDLERVVQINHTLKERAEKAERERNWLASELVDRTRALHNRFLGRLSQGGYIVFNSAKEAIASVLEWAAQEAAKGES